MSTASQVSPNESVLDSKAIVQKLQANPFVKEVTSTKNNQFTIALALQGEVVQVLIDYLSDSGFLRVNREATSKLEPPTLHIHSTQVDTGRTQNELDRAFRKVSQFLEYQDLKKEYASGQVPRHLSQWLLEGGF
jgi:hypothetical protein